MYYNVQPAIPVYNYPQNQQVFPTINAPQPASYYRQPNPMMQGQVPMQQPQPGAQPYYPQPMPNGQQSPAAAQQSPVPQQQDASSVYAIPGGQPATPTQPVTPTQPMTPNQNMVAPNQNMVAPNQNMVAPSGKDVLLAPDQSYYPVNPINNGVSPFPLYQAPKGDPVEVRVEVKDDKVKDRNTLIGVGVGAAAMLVTGGLALPIIAGTVMYNVLKKDGYAKYSAYKNTYVYELRAAIAKDLNVRPEFLLMSRKGVSFDDNEMLQRYMARPNRVTIQVAVLNVPAVGSNYHLANGMPYPPVQSVSLVKPGKK